MKLTVNVTKGHIAHGVRCSTTDCPVTLATLNAIIDAGLPYQCVSASSRNMLIGYYNEQGNHRLVEDIRTPQVAADFIIEFDCAREVAPISFVLDLDDVAIANTREIKEEN